MNEYMNDYPLEFSRGLSLTRFIFGREMRCRNPDEWNRPFLESLALTAMKRVAATFLSSRVIVLRRLSLASNLLTTFLKNMVTKV